MSKCMRIEYWSEMSYYKYQHNTTRDRLQIECENITSETDQEDLNYSGEGDGQEVE